MAAREQAAEKVFIQPDEVFSCQSKDNENDNKNDDMDFEEDVVAEVIQFREFVRNEVKTSAAESTVEAQKRAHLDPQQVRQSASYTGSSLVVFASV